MEIISLGSINLHRYKDLLQRLVPAAKGIGLLSESAKPLWTEGVVQAQLMDDIAARLPALVVVEHGHHKVEIGPGEGCFTICYALLTEAAEPIGWLLVVLETDKPLESCQAYVDAVALLGGYLANEYEMTRELDTMAQELGERYDELNLIYDTNDQADHILEGRASLYNLVQNCSRYLDVSFAGLLMPEKGVVVYHSNQLLEGTDPQELLVIINEQLYPWLQYEKCALVINQLDDPQRISHCPGLIYKLVCCPVLAEGGECCGLLLVLNPHDKADFNNSDRNLMDVMARKAAKIIQSSYDRLTGMINRSSFEQLLEEALSHGISSGIQQCLLHIDIDQLQVLNDTASMEAGDAMIQQVAEVLKCVLRDTDTLARIGGNMFAVLLEHCSLNQAYSVAEKLRNKVQLLKFLWEGQRFESSISVGLIPLRGGEKGQVVMTMAEMACDSAKAHGRNQTQVYAKDNEDYRRRTSEMHWVNRIQDALRENRFELYAQPIIATAFGAGVHHYEILLRMRDQEGAIITPGEFMSAAEHYRLMPALDRWVVSHTLATLANDWDLLQSCNIKWALNLSGQSFDCTDFEQFVCQALEQTSVTAAMIGFEITETAAMDKLVSAQRFMEVLKAKGCEFALDDFGTGLSSFEYLKTLSVDYLKIDGKFVRDMLEDPVSEAMVKAINDVGSVMGLETIAEFVESEEIMDRLCELGVTYGQGYALGRPIPLAQVIDELILASNVLLTKAR